MGHKDRKDREKKEIRENIINAARQIAKKDGWNGVTIRKIANYIEYTPPIVYEYFENKEALFEELVYIGFRKLQNEYHNIKEPIVDKYDYIRTLSIAHWNFAIENNDLYQIMLSIEKVKPNTEMEENFHLTQKIFLGFLNNDHKKAMELMIYWMSLIHGSITFLMFVSPPPDFDGPEPYELFKNNIELFLQIFDKD
jgi:AcrR family transcriptional regulator